MIPILSGNVASALPTGYEVANSCRFYNDTRLSRTTGVTTTNTKFTLSFWIKLCDITNYQMIFETYKASGEYLACGFNLDNSVQPRFYIQEYTGSYIFRKIFTRVSRDISAWSHYCIKYDSTESEATRLRVYVNGTEDTATDTANLPSSSATSIISVGTQYIGYSENQSGHYLHAYLAEFVLVEGTDYAPTDFGEFDEDSPTIWKPKDVSGLTFGTNGFYLDFEDSGDLGDDESGNGNDFTESGIAATDQATDTPTNNFATLNPLDAYYAQGTFSEGNLKYVGVSTKYDFVMSTIMPTSGKWYCEAKYLDGNSDNGIVGISGDSMLALQDYLGEYAGHIGYIGNGGRSIIGGTFTSNLTAYTADDIIGMAMDLDNMKMYFAKNGTWGNSGDPTSGATGTGAFTIQALSTVQHGAYGFAVCSFDSDDADEWFINFGSPPYSISSGNSDANGYGNFEYAVPSGYYALCTKNLAEFG